MSERMTSICAPGLGFGGGLADYGRISVADMVSKYRRYADHWRAIVAAIDATPDDEFHVETYVGVLVHKKREVVQQGKPQ